MSDARRVDPANSGFSDLPLFAQVETQLAPALERVGASVGPGRRVIGADVQKDGIHLSAPFSNPTTSKAAAEEIAPKLNELETIVFDAINGCNGLTCEEVERATCLSHQCASARVRGLVLKGKIEDSGRTRPTKSGRSAIVWKVCK